MNIIECQLKPKQKEALEMKSPLPLFTITLAIVGDVEHNSVWRCSCVPPLRSHCHPRTSQQADWEN